LRGRLGRGGGARGGPHHGREDEPGKVVEVVARKRERERRAAAERDSVALKEWRNEAGHVPARLSGGFQAEAWHIGRHARQPAETAYRYSSLSIRSISS